MSSGVGNEQGVVEVAGPGRAAAAARGRPCGGGWSEGNSTRAEIKQVAAARGTPPPSLARSWRWAIWPSTKFGQIRNL